jgi:hypothetical protein
LAGRAVLCTSFHLQFALERLVQIRFGERKRVFDYFYARFRAIRDDDLNNDKSKKNIGIIEHPQPGQRASRNSLAFLPINRFDRPAEIFTCPGFYFDKNQGVIITTNNVDFTAAASTKIAEQNFVAVTPEISAR